MTDLAAMQKQIDDLEFEVSEYRRILAGPELPPNVGQLLTPSEGRMLRVLLAREIATKDMIAMSLWGIADYDRRDWKSIDVRLCALRKKLRPLNATITTIPHTGYSLDKEWRDRIMAEAAE